MRSNERYRCEQGDIGMKAVTQNLKSGKMQVEDIPPPTLRPEGVLVRVRRSLISLGTERAVLELASMGMVGKARQRPDLVAKVLNKARQEGLWNTFKVIRNLMDSPIPLGYSCAGEIIAVGEDATEFAPGDRIACAGLNFANHAEIDYVPRNLAVKLPAAVSYDAACFVTVGAIAMQGVRLAHLQLGDKVVVMGLGLVGQIVAQLVRCAGGTVIATDLDPSKLELAARLGAHHIVADGPLDAVVKDATGGHGADAVIVCAASKSSDPLRRAGALSRLKGRVIVVGDVGMDIERRAFFEKELEVVVSRSYGPGRYDPSYEARGIDYPLPYVRWTEQRNMQSFLELVARGTVDVASLVTHRFAIADAAAAYRVVTGEVDERAIAMLLEYDGPADLPARVALPAAKATASSTTIRLGVIGAGQFAKAVLLPAFAANRQLQIHAVSTASGLTARDVGQRYGARFCTSDAHEVIADPEIDAILIATRHDLHGRLAAQAIRAGKAVFVEKPLAIDSDSLAQVQAALAAADSPRLLVGYNRRFSPLAQECKSFFADRVEPIAIVYRVNAGSFPADSWVFDPKEGGGRIIGEVCHFVDFICFLTGARPQRLFAEALPGKGPATARDSVCITLRMTDGSVGTIQYLANGDTSVPKEYVEVYCGGRTAILDNFRSLAMHQGNKRKTRRLLNQAKGHGEEVAAFIGAVAGGGEMPIDVETLVAVTQATFLVHASLDVGEVLPCGSPLPALQPY
jgi:predicted dehydrogenase/threonine dehydrogenase-like Zn-dependent dehydrogenase